MEILTEKRREIRSTREEWAVHSQGLRGESGKDAIESAIRSLTR